MHCEYCGTVLDGSETHFAAVCREYVYAALQATKRELAAAREALAHIVVAYGGEIRIAQHSLDAMRRDGGHLQSERGSNGDLVIRYRIAATEPREEPR
jgi:hypothetical protein